MASAASEWLYGDGADAGSEELATRLKDLWGLVGPVQSRREEAAQRPEQISALRASIQQTKSLLETLKESVRQAAVAAAERAASSSSSATEEEVSAMTPPADASEAVRSEGAASSFSEATVNLDDLDDDPFASASAAKASPSAEPEMQPLPAYSEEDLGKLEATFHKVEAWLDEREAAQEKLAPSDEPAVLVKDLKAQGDALNKVVFELLSKQMAKTKAGGSGGKKGGSGKAKAEKAEKSKAKAKAKGKEGKTDEPEEGKRKGKKNKKDEL